MQYKWCQVKVTIQKQASSTHTILVAKLCRKHFQLQRYHNFHATSFHLSPSGWRVTDEQLEEVAIASGVLSVGDDHLDEDFRQKCSQIIANPLEVKPDECIDAFLYLKDRFEQMH